MEDLLKELYDALDELVKSGFVEIADYDENGEPRYRITKEGIKYYRDEVFFLDGRLN